MSYKNILLDFVLGGALVAGAVLAATLVGAVYGGVIAGAPIRACATVALVGVHEGTDFATQTARGVVFAMIANVFFALALYLCLPKVGLWKAFLLAGAVFLAVVAGLMKTGLLKP